MRVNELLQVHFRDTDRVHDSRECQLSSSAKRVHGSARDTEASGHVADGQECGRRRLTPGNFRVQQGYSKEPLLTCIRLHRAARRLSLECRSYRGLQRLASVCYMYVAPYESEGQGFNPLVRAKTEGSTVTRP